MMPMEVCNRAPNQKLTSDMYPFVSTDIFALIGMQGISSISCLLLVISSLLCCEKFCRSIVLFSLQYR